MFLKMSLLSTRLKYGFSLNTVLWGTTTHESELAGVKPICHTVDLQAIINVEEMKKACILNEERQDGTAGTVLNFIFWRLNGNIPKMI